MRWMLLLLVPCVVCASDLSGTWSIPPNEAGFINRVTIVDVSNDIEFHYESDGGRACEAMGTARRRTDTLYVFRNVKENQVPGGSELYGLEENEDCEISFERDGATLKVRTTGNCRSFCGINGDIGGDLQKVSAEQEPVPAGAQSPQGERGECGTG